MTPEQFVYWLSGFVSGLHIPALSLEVRTYLEEIEAALKAVKTSASSGEFMACFTGDSS